jgi:hypothetical protein
LVAAQARTAAARGLGDEVRRGDPLLQVVADDEAGRAHLDHPMLAAGHRLRDHNTCVRFHPQPGSGESRQG